MSKLEGASHICVIVVCVLVGYVLVDQRFFPKRPSLPARATAREGGLVAGKRADIWGIDWAAARLNLVVAMTTRCKYCLASMPLYHRLGEMSKAGGAVGLFVVSSEPAETVSAFLANEKVNARKVLEVPLGSFGVTATPTMLLVDPAGLIKKTYVGKLSAAQEEDLFANIAAPSPRNGLP